VAAGAGGEVVTEMEAAYVGRLISDQEALTSARIRPEQLSDTFLQEVLKVAVEVASCGSDVNLLTLADASSVLSSRAGDLASLTTVAAPGKLDYYEDRLTEEYRRRELAKLGRELAEINDESDEILGWIDTRLEEITATDSSDRIRSQGEVLRHTIDVVEERYKLGGALPGLATGFPALDEMTMGLRPRTLTYIAARPSQGKSAMLMNMALFVSRSVPVGVISLESDATELTMRAVSSEGSIEAHRLSTGAMGPGQFASMGQVVDKLKDRPLYYYDQPNAPIDRVAGIARLMHRKYGIKALFIDYLQIISVHGRDMSKRERVEIASLRLKQLARELGISVVAGAQAKREDGARPTLESFQHSDQSGQDADVAIFLYPKGGVTWAIVGKNRDGQKGDVALRFEGKFVRFVEEEDQENLPTF
jgi:replicative DNA helicase